MLLWHAAFKSACHSSQNGCMTCCCRRSQIQDACQCFSTLTARNSLDTSDFQQHCMPVTRQLQKVEIGLCMYAGHQTVQFVAQQQVHCRMCLERLQVV